MLHLIGSVHRCLNRLFDTIDEGKTAIYLYFIHANDPTFMFLLNHVRTGIIGTPSFIPTT